MLAPVARLGSVLADPIPDTVWMSSHHTYRKHGDSLARVMHREAVAGVVVDEPMDLAEFVARRAECRSPLAGMEQKPGAEAWAYTPLWCVDCFGIGRCRRWVVDTYGKNRKRCGQPSGDAAECRWHHNLDVTLDQRIGDAA